MANLAEYLLSINHLETTTEKQSWIYLNSYSGPFIKLHSDKQCRLSRLSSQRLMMDNFIR